MYDMYLRKTISRNLQNHKEVVIDLPETGLVVFAGGNSNGKSVICRTTIAILKGELRKPRIRSSLVNRNAQYAEIEYLRSDDVTLLVHISRAANLTYVTYTMPGEEPITRYLADKSYMNLVERFGWHYDPDAGISLNIAEAEDSLLFYKTPFKANGSVLRTATSDSRADLVATNIDTTLKDTRTFRENCIQQVTMLQNTLKELKIEPIDPLIEKREKLDWCLRNLEHIKYPNIPEIKAVPNVKYIGVKYPTLPTIKPVPDVTYVSINYPNLPAVRYPLIVSFKVNLPDIVDTAKELSELRNKRCPTCGRRFVDGSECESVLHNGLS